jgi:plastocyanin
MPHTTTAKDGSFDSGMLNPSDSFTYTFSKAGAVDFYCTYHPEQMQGKIEIKGK